MSKIALESFASCLTVPLDRLSLAMQTANDPALTGLLRVYKNYYPEIVVGDAVRGRASAFNVGIGGVMLVEPLDTA